MRIEPSFPAVKSQRAEGLATAEVTEKRCPRVRIEGASSI